MKRWVVRPGEAKTVADVLVLAREEPRAVGEGRVFVGRRRVDRLDAAVKAGDEVRIGGAAKATPGEAVPILFEKAGLVACVKPAGIPTVPDHSGASHALVALVARRIGVAPDKLLVTSRLDREVSGVVVFALTEAAERRLKAARAEGTYHRRYVALAVPALPGATLPQVLTWDAPIGRGKGPRHRAAFGPEAKAASTRAVVVASSPGAAVHLLAVDPRTGRTHQIRIHAAHAGLPLLGDRAYGGPARMVTGAGAVIGLARVGLHAARVCVPDEAGQPLVAEADVPQELRIAWAELGGAPEAWNRASSCAVPP